MMRSSGATRSSSSRMALISVVFPEPLAPTTRMFFALLPRPADTIGMIEDADLFGKCGPRSCPIPKVIFSGNNTGSFVLFKREYLLWPKSHCETRVGGYEGTIPSNRLSSTGSFVSRMGRPWFVTLLFMRQSCSLRLLPVPTMSCQFAENLRSFALPTAKNLDSEQYLHTTGE
jgi:hypothetical protein